MTRRIVGAAVLVLGASLVASPAQALCGRDCKTSLRSEFRSCKRACPRGTARMACRAACISDFRADRVTCDAATNPTPPKCGELPPSCSTLGAPCGGCGNGRCVLLCGDGCVMGCVATPANPPSCTTDAQCSSTDYCVVTAGCPGNCGTVATCAPPCP